ncbi:hypothetical protein QC764_205370 [Podospora pseudoanserina]|uniref:Dipeptidyl peptidase 3 n=1 Tax=Podospora pseudoanserina TaxID=2609844 RepID=A0ABR0IGP7_9PEZI|nr:hypothetical protein QC764_205370 [Podospora pseudoanserina]
MFRFSNWVSGTKFNGVTEREQRYAHHMARAAWYGARIILEQVSPESRPIFDFILELHRACSGNWDAIVGQVGMERDQLQQFLTYAATFLSNVGNHYGSGDQNLGFLSDTTQSSYYPGDPVSEEEITMVSRILEQNSILPENTRIRRANNSADDSEVLVASVQRDDDASRIRTFPTPGLKGVIRLIRGDHSSALGNICNELTQAAKFAANDTQFDFLRKYAESFQTGSLNTYRESQRIWDRDEAPRVDFSSIHPLAYCSSIIFPGVNLPNYNDIRQEDGFKNVIISNRMATESRALQYPFIDPSEAETFIKHKFPAYHWLVVLHELLGHGTGQMMVETEEGKHNFDIDNPPISPLTGKPMPALTATVWGSIRMILAHASSASETLKTSLTC